MGKTRSAWRSPPNANYGHHPLAIALSHAILNDVADYRLAQLSKEEADKKYPPQFPEHLCDPASFDLASMPGPDYGDGTDAEGFPGGDARMGLVDLDAAAVEAQCVAATIDAGGA